MQNVVVNMSGKFHNDRLRNDRSLGNWESDNNTKNKNKVQLTKIENFVWQMNLLCSRDDFFIWSLTGVLA